jgi:hypothetical protein
VPDVPPPAEPAADEPAADERSGQSTTRGRGRGGKKDE